mmetsp:Transcript_107203/g.313479  ORF Transcript_107203/g.313479 Transcript_107203/m.313479 type:complete len:242 (+) Transcript_107203:111-836(+)
MHSSVGHRTGSSGCSSGAARYLLSVAICFCSSFSCAVTCIIERVSAGVDESSMWLMKSSYMMILPAYPAKRPVLRLFGFSRYSKVSSRARRERAVASFSSSPVTLSSITASSSSTVMAPICSLSLSRKRPRTRSARRILSVSFCCTRSSSAALADDVIMLSLTTEVRMASTAQLDSTMKAANSSCPTMVPVMGSTTEVSPFISLKSEKSDVGTVPKYSSASSVLPVSRPLPIRVVQDTAPA